MLSAFQNPTANNRKRTDLSKYECEAFYSAEKSHNSIGYTTNTNLNLAIRNSMVMQFPRLAQYFEWFLAYQPCGCAASDGHLITCEKNPNRTSVKMGHPSKLSNLCAAPGMSHVKAPLDNQCIHCGIELVSLNREEKNEIIRAEVFINSICQELAGSPKFNKLWASADRLRDELLDIKAKDGILNCIVCDSVLDENKNCLSCASALSASADETQTRTGS